MTARNLDKSRLAQKGERQATVIEWAIRIGTVILLIFLLLYLFGVLPVKDKSNYQTENADLLRYRPDAMYTLVHTSCANPRDPVVEEFVWVHYRELDEWISTDSIQDVPEDVYCAYLGLIMRKEVFWCNSSIWQGYIPSMVISYVSEKGNSNHCLVKTVRKF